MRIATITIAVAMCLFTLSCYDERQIKNIADVHIGDTGSELAQLHVAFQIEEDIARRRFRQTGQP